MVFVLICILVLVILIALFIGKNLDNTTAIWLFKTFEDTNVAVIVFTAFAVGIIFTLLLLGISKLYKYTKEQSIETEAAPKKDKKKKSVFHTSLARTHKKEDSVSENESTPDNKNDE